LCMPGYGGHATTTKGGAYVGGSPKLQSPGFAFTLASGIFGIVTHSFNF
jgi:hypothetical protein